MPVKIEIEVRYPAIGTIQEGLRGPIAYAFETMDSETIELDIRECADVADAPAFSIDVAAVLPSSRMLLDPKATMTHLGRPWMAVVEKDAKEETSRRVRRIGSVLEHVYAGIVEKHRRAQTLQEGRALFEAIAKEVSGSAQDFAIFGDGRIYQADVVPIYEVKGVYAPSVAIVPSSTPRIATAQYFGPDQRDEAEACLRQMEMKAGVDEPYRMPMIMRTDLAPRTEVEIAWGLKDAAKRVVSGLWQGIEPEYRNRWMDRLGGEGFAAIVTAVSTVASDHDMDLERSTQAFTDFSDALRSGLPLPSQDPTAGAVEILRARIDDARGIILNRTHP
jgi:hypothetical protein